MTNDEKKIQVQYLQKRLDELEKVGASLGHHHYLLTSRIRASKKPFNYAPRQ